MECSRRKLTFPGTRRRRQIGGELSRSVTLSCQVMEGERLVVTASYGMRGAPAPVVRIWGSRLAAGPLVDAVVEVPACGQGDVIGRRLTQVAGEGDGWG